MPLTVSEMQSIDGGDLGVTALVVLLVVKFLFWLNSK